MKTILTVVLFAVSFCPAQQPVATAGPDVATELTRRYADQTLLLRHAIQSDVQTYDAAGKLLTPGEEGPWTLYAALRTTRISADARKLRIEGDRIVFLYDKTEKMLVPERRKEPLQVDIQLAGPLMAADDAVPLLQSVFAMNTDELIKSEPEFWNFYLTKETEDPRALQQLGLPAHKRNHRWFDTRRKARGQVFHGSDKKMHPPEATFTPEPSYTEIAKERGLQGSVVIDAIVDTTGKVLQPLVVQPLGMGLDENAIETIKTWRFKPGTRKGRPVLTELQVAIDFSLVN